MEKSIENEDLISKIFNQIPGAIIQCQVFSNGYFRFPFVSEGLWEIFEIHPKDVIDNGTLILQRISENDKDKFINSIKQSTIYLTQWELDFSVNLPLKGLKWLRGIAQPERQHDGSTILHGYITDVTERKLAARALIKKEQHWHFALESSEEGIWDYNFRDNVFYLSNKLIENLGYNSEFYDHSADFWFNKIHPEDSLRFQLDIRMHIKGETEMFMSENRMLCENGTYKWILHKGKIIEWTNNKTPLRMIGTHSDISEKKEREILLENNLKLISEQNTRLSNFTYIVSHNLRTHTGNLDAIINLIESAETQEEREAEFAYLKSISTQLNETIAHLTEVLSIQNSKIKEIKKLNLFHFAEKAKKTLLKEIEKKGAVLQNHIPVETEINHNPAYLESILYNLVSNSIKYSSPERKPIISLNCYREDNFMVLKISDNGLGFDLDRHKDNIFGMYKTFHGNSDAKGIGLFITKNQIESLDGKIRVESAEDKGCTFYVYLRV